MMFTVFMCFPITAKKKASKHFLLNNLPSGECLSSDY